MPRVLDLNNPVRSVRTPPPKPLLMDIRPTRSGSPGIPSLADSCHDDDEMPLISCQVCFWSASSCGTDPQCSCQCLCAQGRNSSGGDRVRTGDSGQEAGSELGVGSSPSSGWGVGIGGSLDDDPVWGKSVENPQPECPVNNKDD